MTTLVSSYVRDGMFRQVWKASFDCLSRMAAWRNAEQRQVGGCVWLQAHLPVLDKDRSVPSGLNHSLLRSFFLQRLNCTLIQGFSALHRQHWEPVILCRGVCPGHCGQLASSQPSLTLNIGVIFRRFWKLNMELHPLFRVIYPWRTFLEGVNFGCTVVMKCWRALLWEE